MFKRIFLLLIVSCLFLPNLFAVDLFLTKDEVTNPHTAVKEVLRVFKRQIKIPLSKVFIKIPYNINYYIKINNNTYEVTEYKIRIIFKTVKNSLITNEKKYIIRFLIDDNTNKVVKEEIYTITDEKYYKKDIYNID